jgi:aspartyl aminopeptidase
MEPDASVALELADFITRSPSPFHVTAEVARRLSAAGFSPAAGSAGADSARGYLVRDGSVLAWSVPESVSESTPVRIVAAHTDSPTFKLKPRPDAGAAGWLQAGT